MSLECFCGNRKRLENSQEVMFLHGQPEIENQPTEEFLLRCCHSRKGFSKDEDARFNRAFIRYKTQLLLLTYALLIPNMALASIFLELFNAM